VILPYVLAAPWLGLLLFVLLRVRLPRELPEREPNRAPSVTVVVPARNEVRNIETCVRSISAQDYPVFDIVVVDDRSDDGTGAIARELSPGRATSLRVLEGEDLPSGWLGKPWACWQGALAATGALLLFTDADTTHEPELLARAVTAMEEDDAQLLTVTGRQLMLTFWERLIQPQVFFAMLMRYYDLEGMLRRGRWRSAIANGQYMLFRREAYEALGGHEAVKGEVVEDLALAQRIVRSGRRLSMRRAETSLSTRMYRSLAELVRGWSKNIVIGGLQTMPPKLRPFVAPASALTGAAAWVVPPLLLVACAVGLVASPAALAWSAATVGLSLVLWVLVTARMGAPPAYGLLYPVGATAGLYIFLRAWARGGQVEWKGRRYRLDEEPEAS
jgi:chlorobactene glucosyltransferase